MAPDGVDPDELKEWRKKAFRSKRQLESLSAGTETTGAIERVEEPPFPTDTDTGRVLLDTEKPLRTRRRSKPKESNEVPAHIQVRRALEPEQRLPTDPELRKKHELDELLKLAVSGTLERIPQSDGDVELFGKNRLPVTTGISRKELEEIDRTGGIRPWIEANHGPGTYRLLINGRSTSLLHEQLVEIPSLFRHAKKLEAERLARESLVRAQQRKEAEERERREKEEREFFAREGWVREMADMAIRESARRIQWAEVLWSQALSHAVAQIRNGFKLNRIGHQIAKLRSKSTTPEQTEEDDADNEDHLELESVATAVGTMEVMQPFLDSLRRVRSIDLDVLRDRVARFLWDRGPVLLRAHSWDVAAAVDFMLPVVPDWRFSPWLELIPPPPPAEAWWDPTWGGHGQGFVPTHEHPVPSQMPTHAYSR